MRNEMKTGPTPEMAEKWPPKDGKKWPKPGQNSIFGSICPF